MSITTQWISKNFDPEQQQAFAAGLSPSDKQAILSDNLKALSPAAFKVLDDKHTEVTAPQYVSASQRLGQNHPFIGHAAADFATAGTDMVNAVRHGLGMTPDATNYYNTYGVKKNVADQVATPLIGFAATAPLGGEGAGAVLGEDGLNIASKLAPQTLKNAKLLGANAVGGAAVSPNNPAQGALAGADTAGILEPVGPATVNALKFGAKKMIGSPAQNLLAKSAATSIANRTNAAPGLGNAVQSEFDRAMGEFNSHQQAAEQSAQSLDTRLNANTPFDASPYYKTLTDFIDKYNNSTPVGKSALQDAHDFAQEQISNGVIPQNFSDLMSQNRQLNNAGNKFFTARYGMHTAADKPTTGLIKQLKRSIQDTFDKNAQNLDLPQANDVKNSFNSANNAYSRAMSLAQTPDTLGNPVPDKGLLAALKSGNATSDATEKTLSNKYLNRGTRGYELLKNQIGEQNANKAIASQVFKNSGGTQTDLEGLNSRSLLNNYLKLPEGVRKNVFTDGEQRLLGALQKSKADVNFGNKNSKLNAILENTSPGLLGAGAGAIWGYKKGGLEGAALGAGGGLAGGSLLGKFFENPALLESLYGEAPFPGSGSVPAQAALGTLRASKRLLPVAAARSQND